MSFLATLTVDDKTFDVMECVSELEQVIDAKGRAISSVKGGNIRLVILAAENDDTIPVWASDKTKKHDGKITMLGADMQSKFKEIEFKNAYVTWYAESFSLDTANEENFKDGMVFQDDFDEEIFEKVQRSHRLFNASYLVHFKISAREITVGDVQITNYW